MPATRGRGEAAFAARWAAGEWRGETLAALGGERFVVVYQGRPGGGTGPDFRDAVLMTPDGTRVYGDVELHVRPECWRAHGHERDPRYNGLALHIAVRPARTGAVTTTLASGRSVPLVLLSAPVGSAPAGKAWPCAGLARRLDAHGLRALLIAASLARFRQRAALLAAEIWSAEGERTDQVGSPASSDVCASRPGSSGGMVPPDGWSAADRVLFVALAEALGYGRDRAALRAAGAGLASGAAPEDVALLADRLPRVEAQRLRGLLALYARWRPMGPWPPLRAALTQGPLSRAGRVLLARLGVPGGLVSPGRAAIVAANVVLPFAAALGECARDAALMGRAEAVYLALPGLPSNAITRLMGRQLGFTRLPRGAAAQLGLQHVWAEACREKRCDACPCHLIPLGNAPT